MTVSFLGALNKITETREKNMTASTVKELLMALLQKYGKGWKEQVFDGKTLTDGVVIM